ncbi:ribosomal protein L3 [Cenarchaeum symbiosum A]|uniref:50S ribosomal protein L3 n=1 Tax=Cenarchaeum symbiosum (strain A) TaxID=414004 RepID=A0RVX4_CENSY|nr:ribosomal protein L3 [Cenarchaeum symbiosum A]
MGHRKFSQPRRGSLAYSPRGRARSMEARIRGWPERQGEPRLLAHAGFKAGCIQIVSIDDREHTPNAGKQLVSLGTVLVTPPLHVLGMRGYSKGHYGRHVKFDVFAEDLPREVAKYIVLRNGRLNAERAETMLGGTAEIYGILGVSPRSAGLEQKRPYIFEAPVRGGSMKERFAYLKDLLGKTVKASDVLEPGAGVDVAAITKGKGWQGVIQRMGAKRKQHKSRKTVRELGSLGPISPQNVMYTVPRAGQMGFHQRIEYNKRIMAVGSAGEDDAINPSGGYKHFGMVKGDYIVLKGSVPGTYRRLVKLRAQIRNAPKRTSKPNILEMVV